ncbi:MAG: GNAT family N-acetyltransferase [Methylococcaceae bacterium]
MCDFTRVHTQERVSDVVNLAREIWRDHYVPIIGQEQVDYMLGEFQSEKAIAAQLADGYEYYIVTHVGKSVGYLAIVQNADEEALMISKIYVTKSGRGQGFGRKMLSFAEDVCRERKLRTLWLTVNKHNILSIAWYIRMGFKNIGPTVQDIGAGFVMDDYRMEKPISITPPLA